VRVTAGPAARPTARPGARVTAGLAVATLLGVADLLILGLPGSSAAGTKPPTSVLVFDAMLGVATLVGVAFGWAHRWPGATAAVVTGRALSALGDLPGLFTAGAQARLIALAATLAALNLLAVLLIAWPGRPSRTL